jgi:hypothetical protein
MKMCNFGWFFFSKRQHLHSTKIKYQSSATHALTEIPSFNSELKSQEEELS